ncbi:MAG: ABC transporter ATP-binding protein [Candidatus Hadarchaeales archaeon]
MVEVELEHLCKEFGSVKAVDNLDLEIKDREFMVFLGPSGCGKTTALRLIAGLEKPTKGRILFNGKCVNDLEPKERNVAMVFQEYALYPHMTVFDNMALCLQVDKVPKEEIVERVTKTAEILQITHLLRRRPTALSGGQQQRVALGRAIVRNPSIYLMDEPLSNLDALFRVSMRTELKKLHNKLKTTTVYVTHDQAEAMVLADRVAVLKDGKLLQLDRPKTIYDCPANKFIAEFIGSPKINFVTGDLVRRRGKVFFEATGDFSLLIPLPLWRALKRSISGSKITIGIRPEHIQVSEKRMRGAMPAKVYFSQQMGNVKYLELDAGGTKMTAVVRPDFGKDVGSTVYLTLSMECVRFFDEPGGVMVA